MVSSASASAAHVAQVPGELASFVVEAAPEGKVTEQLKQEILNSDLALIMPQTRKILRSMEPNVIADAVQQLQSM